MGLGSAMAGGNPTDERQRNDFYPTPREVTLALLREHKFQPVIWDCCAGDGAILKEAINAGYKVVGNDIEPQHPKIAKCDFFDIKTNNKKSIITNPPFKLAEKFIRHAFDIGVTEMAMVLKSSYYHAKSREDLFLEYRPSYIHPLLWRPDFLNKGRPTMECMWVVWKEPCAKQCVYSPLQKPI